MLSRLNRLTPIFRGSFSTSKKLGIGEATVALEQKISKIS